MDKRLCAIAEKVTDGTGVIDVGTDHGYLPVYLALHGYSGNIIASDINPSPLKTGMENAAEANVSDRISFILSDGLEGCTPGSVDTIIIAGMGGDTITGILDRARWVFDPGYLLILQPMTKSEVLRYWLVNNGFGIFSEKLAEEGGMIYQIISARFGGSTELNDAELFLGRYELTSEPMLYAERLGRMLRNVEKSIAGMERAASAKIAARRKLLTEINDQLLLISKKCCGEGK